MKTIKANNKGHVSLFRNPLLEVLTKSNPLFSWCMFVTVIIVLLNYSITVLGFGVGFSALLFIAGLVFWTLFEYLVHRFVFHWVSSNPVVEKMTYLFHGNHHHFPRDRQRLFMPPVPSLLIAGAVFTVMYLVIGKYAFVFFPGFILGHLLHASLHYAIHAWHPPFKWMKPLWRNHHLHHYTSVEKGFGITSTLWDHVFGTMFDLEKFKEDKAKVRELMFEESKAKVK
jgi:sterol desaturase/sphingolipid hydroxylase (fatty acid hydroxylase superfamily)